MYSGKQLLLATALLAIAHGAHGYQSRWVPEDGPFACPSEGFFCSSCHEVVYCEKIPGGYKPFVTEDCSGTGGTCTERGGAGACTVDPDLQCDPSATTYRFNCFQSGVFPDPFTCRKYYMCTKNGSAPITINCPGGYGFNVKTLRCDIKFINGKGCANVTAPCRNYYDFTAPIAGNAAYYTKCSYNYTTRYYYPHVYQCLNDFIFVGGKCVDPITHNEAIVNGVCNGYGKMYTPNCNQYNECSWYQAPKTVSCAPGQQFDVALKQCVDIGCRYRR